MASTTSRKRSRVGLALMAVGVVVTAFGVFAGGASAEGTATPTCTPSLELQWGLDATGFVNLDGLLSGGTSTAGNDDLTVTLSNAKPITGESLTALTIGSLDFTTSKPVQSVVVRLWQSPGNYDFTTVNYNPAVTTGQFTSPQGSHPELGQAPIKGLKFCYQKPAVIPTSTTQAPTTTKAPTTTAVQVAPQVTSTSTTTAAPAVVPEVEVLPQVVTAPTETQPQLAFTGSDSKPMLLIGGVLLLLGLSLVAADRVGLVRKGRHSR